MNKMKTSIGIISALAFVLFFQYSCGNENRNEELADSTGMPGDNFSLAGALHLLKESNDLEAFEKGLNTTKGEVNNLDLNGDGKIDYIRVMDLVKENSHAIVLQIPVSETEVQDVAVISIMKTGNEKAMIQIKGNEMLYGDSAVLSPGKEQSKIVSAAMLPLYYTAAVVEVNVWGWPAIPVLFSPTYVVYKSPAVGFNIYPAWYTPRAPQPYGWYRREVAHKHKKQYQPVYILNPNPALYLYGPGLRNSGFVVNRYQNIYVRTGFPKTKGKAYYGPSGPKYMKNGPSRANPKMNEKSQMKFKTGGQKQGNPKGSPSYKGKTGGQFKGSGSGKGSHGGARGGGGGARGGKK